MPCSDTCVIPSITRGKNGEVIRAWCRKEMCKLQYESWPRDSWLHHDFTRLNLQVLYELSFYPSSAPERYSLDLCGCMHRMQSLDPWVQGFLAVLLCWRCFHSSYRWWDVLWHPCVMLGVWASMCGVLGGVHCSPQQRQVICPLPFTSPCSVYCDGAWLSALGLVDGGLGPWMSHWCCTNVLVLHLWYTKDAPKSHWWCTDFRTLLYGSGIQAF